MNRSSAKCKKYNTDHRKVIWIVSRSVCSITHCVCEPGMPPKKIHVHFFQGDLYMYMYFDTAQMIGEVKIEYICMKVNTVILEQRFGKTWRYIKVYSWDKKWPWLADPSTWMKFPWLHKNCSLTTPERTWAISRRDHNGWMQQCTHKQQ